MCLKIDSVIRRMQVLAQNVIHVSGATLDFGAAARDLIDDRRIVFHPDPVIGHESTREPSGVSSSRSGR